MPTSNIFVENNLSFDLNSNLKDKDTQVYYVRNGDTSDYNNIEQTSFIQNATSNELCVKYPKGYEYKGFIKLDLEDYILFLHNGITSAIYLFDQKLCTLLPVIESDCLNFINIVSGSFKYIGNHRVIYFNDDVNVPRYLNLGKIPYQTTEPCDSCTNQTVNKLDCDKLKIFQDFTPPNIKIEVTDGNIPDGVYQFAIARTNENDNGDWFIYSEKINLHGINNQAKRNGFKLSFDCFNYEGQFKVAMIAHREDRGTVAQEIGIFSSKIKTVSISNLDSPYYFPISNEQLFETNSVYISAKYTISNSEQLVMGSLKERQDINYQYQANQIISEVGVFKVRANKAHLYPSFMSDEVYAFDIQGIYRDGQATDYFHIPNNTIPDSSWFQNTSNADVWQDGCTTKVRKKYEIYNSAQLLEIIEANDNGSSATNLNSNCVTYYIKSESHDYPGTLYYKDCNGTQIVIPFYPTYDNHFCTSDPTSIAFIPDLLFFNKAVDLIQSNNTCVGANCVSYSFSSKFRNPNSKFKVTYTDCNNSTQVYSGPLTNFSFCTVYAGNLTNVTVLIEPLTHSVELYATNVCDNAITNPVRNGVCDFKLAARSTFAYYESSIKYDNRKGNFSNLPQFTNCKTGIRYHKFPDRTQTLNGQRFPAIHSQAANSQSTEFIYILAPKFYNIQPFLDCAGNPVKDIIGYRISYKSRDNNKSIIQKGILFNMREETLADCTKSYYPNYPFNDLSPDIFLGTKEYITERNIDDGYNGTFLPQSVYSKTKFQYISPDIQYQKNDTQATDLVTYSEENGYISGLIDTTAEMPKVVVLSEITYALLGILASFAALSQITILGSGTFKLDVTDILIRLPDAFHKLSAGHNYAYNVVETSNYSKNNTTNIVQGNRIFQIKDSVYLQPAKQLVNGVKINNNERESGLYINLDRNLLDPSIVEHSRVDYSTVKYSNFSDVNQTDLKSSSYYVGLKKEQISQYGDLQDGIRITMSDLIRKNDSGYLISGDIYISKHKVIKKFPFFNNLPLNAPFDTPYVTSAFSNICYPKYWIDVVDRNETFNVITHVPIVALVLDAIGLSLNHFYLGNSNPPTKSNCHDPKTLNTDIGLVRGMFYTHIIGICEYYCESEYIAEYREVNEIPQSDYNRDSTLIKRYDNILYPERFIYSQQQRFKGVPSKYKGFDLTKDCCNKPDYSHNRLIFSLKSDPLSKSDKWLKFRSQNYHQFEHQDGMMTNMFHVNNYNVLFTFENAAYITQADEGLLTNKGQLYIGSGSIFERRLKKISQEINGLGGSIDRYSFVNTPFGVFWADRNRKTFIYFSGEAIQDISEYLKSYFIQWNNKEIKGIYDSFSRNIYWTNGDWTVSYKPETKKWISWHDWKPDWLINTNFNFLTTIKEPNGITSIWKHNVKNNYQTYYGTEYPFEIGFTVNNKFKQEIFTNLEIFSEFTIPVAWGQKEYTKHFFNKVMAYSDRTSTGIKNLQEKTSNGFQQNKDSNVEYTAFEDVYKINGLKNIADHQVKGNSLIKWDNYKYELISTKDNLVDEKNSRIYSKWLNVHFMSEGHTNIKKMIQLNITNSKPIAK